MKNISGIIGEFPGNKRITTWRKIKWLPVTVLEIVASRECSYSTDCRPSLLDRLKCPEPSVYARKRKVKTNPPVGAKESQRHSALSLTHVRPEIYLAGATRLL